MTRDEVISKLLLLGFKKNQHKSILRYKNIMDIYIPSDNDKIYYSTHSAKQHNHIIPIDDDYVLEKILKFIEDNPNDC